jgi:hypothetical protein
VRIAQIYGEKALNNTALYDQAAQKYIEAGLLYEKEQDFLKRDKSNQQALVQLQKKYKYRENYDLVQRNLRQSKHAADINNQELRKVRSRLRQIERTIRTDFADMEPPKYLTDEREKLEKRLQVLESGLGDQDAQKLENLEKLRKSIENELANLKKVVRKQLDM